MEDTHKLKLKTYFEKFVAKDTDEAIEDQNTGAESLTFDIAKCVTLSNYKVNKKDEIADERQSDSPMDLESNLIPSTFLKIEMFARGETQSSCEDDSIAESESHDEEQAADTTTTSFEEEEPSGTAVKLPWYCGMLFECKLCQKQFFEMSELKRHLTSGHEVSLEAMSAEHGDPTVASNFHECLVCGRGIPHCNTAIRGHLNVHDLSLSLYYEQYRNEIDSETVSLPINDKALLAKLSLGLRLTTPSTFSADDSNDQTLKANFDWLNKCTYTCKICDYTTNIYSTFHKHLDKTHKFTGKAYMEKHGGKLGSNIVHHICQLCGFVVDWDRSKIRQHLVYKHPSNSVQEYVQTFENTYTDNPLLIENEDDKWMNQCIFECKECTEPESFNTRSKLIFHLHTKHTLTIKEYTDKHGSMFLKFANHKCKLCEKSIRWDSDSIIAHLAACHSMTPQDYVKDHLKDLKSLLSKLKKQKSRPQSLNMAPLENKSPPPNKITEWLNRCTFECQVCSFETNSYPSIFPHINNVHKISTKAYMEKYDGKTSKNIVLHACQLCGYILNWDRSTIVNHLATKHHSVSIIEYYQEYEHTYEEFPILLENEKDQWMNQCIFECIECPQKENLNTRNKLILHLHKEHQMSIKDYLDKHGRSIATVIYMNCKICEKAIRWDSDSIVAHLDKFHQMTPDNYVKGILKGDVSSLLSTIKQGSPKPSSNHSVTSQTSISRYEWLNRCVYSCNICNIKVNNSGSYFSHVTKVHKISSKAYMDLNGGKLCSTLVNHTCQLCGFILVWDRTSIVKHLQAKHNSITIHEYAQTYEHTYTDYPMLIEEEADSWMNQCVFVCKQCETPTEYTTRNKLILHLYKEHKLRIKDYLEKGENPITTLVNHTCKICDKVVRWDSDSIKAHLDRYHSATPSSYMRDFLKNDIDSILSNTTKSVSRPSFDATNQACPKLLWNDKCTFACQICFLVVKSKDILRWHLQNEHKMKEIYYSEHFNAEPFEKVTHSCMICAEETLFDSQTMKKHLQASHNKMHLDLYKTDNFDNYSCNQNSQDSDQKFKSRNKYFCKICSTVTNAKDLLITIYHLL